MYSNAPPMEHIARKPVESSRAYVQRRKTMAVGILIALMLGGALAILLLGCGGSPSPVKQNPPPPADVPLTKLEVMSIVQNAALAVDGSTMAIAVVDRRGDVLAVYNKPGVVPGTTKDIGNFGTPVDVDDLAVALARTAAPVRARASSRENRNSTTVIRMRSIPVGFPSFVEIWSSAELESLAFLMTRRNLPPSAAQKPPASVSFLIHSQTPARSSSAESLCLLSATHPCPLELTPGRPTATISKFARTFPLLAATGSPPSTI